MDKALGPYKTLLEDLKRAHENGRLAHGYIFFGEDAAGRHAASEALARLFEHGSFDGYGGILAERLLIEPDAAGAIGIDAVRRAQEFLWQTPQASPYRLAVFASAEAFTGEAEHALLKITEEPPPHGMIIIETHDPGVLLPAIQSRFQRIYFGKGEAFKSVPKEIRAYAKKFIAASRRERSQMIRELVDGKTDCGTFLAALMLELRPATKRNAVLLRLILQKEELLAQYNVNKRLQLEVINQAL